MCRQGFNPPPQRSCGATGVCSCCLSLGQGLTQGCICFWDERRCIPLPLSVPPQCHSLTPLLPPLLPVKGSKHYLKISPQGEVAYSYEGFTEVIYNLKITEFSKRNVEQRKYNMQISERQCAVIYICGIYSLNTCWIKS